MKYIVIDLEMNNVKAKTEAKKICKMETIEIGAVMLDEDLQEISSFRTYVKPEYNDKITPKIHSLTGITYDVVENAPRFCEAFRMFSNWCYGTGDEIKVYAWSNTDFLQIKKEMLLKNYEMNENEELMMGNEWQDFQKEFDAYMGFESQVSLSSALDMAGLNFAGKAHNALDDARSTGVLIHMFNNKEKFDSTLQRIKEYLTPSTFGVALGSLVDSSVWD